MFYLLLAIISSALVSIVMRLGVSVVKNRICMLWASYAACLVIACFYVRPQDFQAPIKDVKMAAALGVICGILLLIGFILLQVNVRLNGVVLSATFAKLGVLVPALLSVVVFHERLQLIQEIGFVLALIAILMINLEKEGEKAKYRSLLVVLLIGSGSADAMAKVYEELGSAQLEGMYLFVTFASAVIFSGLLVLWQHMKISMRDIGAGLLLGIPNFYSVRFLMRALVSIPAVITYPTYSVAAIVIISFAGIVFFKEKPDQRQKTAIIIILAALVFLNI